MPRTTKVPARTRSRKIISNDAPGAVYDRPHVCSIEGCGKAFTRSEHLKRHQLNHEKAQWVCQVCSASFVRKDLFQRHLTLNHGGSASESADDEDKTPSAAQVQATQELYPYQAPDEVNESLPTLAAPLLDIHSEGLMPMLSTELSFGNTDSSWHADIDSWKSGISGNPWSRLNDMDLDWFWQNQDPAFDFPIEHIVTPELPTVVPLIHTFAQERDSSGHYAPPRYLQEARSKTFIASPGDIGPPNCGYPICNALTQDRRIELLMDLRDIIEIDIRDPTFSLNSMKQGIHLFFREIATEYSFVHRELLLLKEDRDLKEALLEVLGESPGAQLIWSIISFGWTLMRSTNNHEFHLASTIQRAIRATILNHPRLTSSPPLWLVQTLFIALLFAKFQGTSEEYGIASMFHGVLLEAVLRLDYGPDKAKAHLRNSSVSSHARWLSWIEAESVRRLIAQTFVLDIKNALLFGGEPLMTFRDMTDLRIPSDRNMAWYAQTCDEWDTAMSSTKDDADSPSFLTMLKDFWRPSAQGTSSVQSPSNSITFMYGILSVAREITRREEGIILQRANLKPSSLSQTIERALMSWERAWTKAMTNTEVPWMVPTCSCVLLLAKSTLYEISPVDLQIVAGKHVIDGRRKSPSDYTNARRKIKAWAREERGLRGILGAANIIQSRLSGDKAPKHCQHCLWCLYLAALICWNYEYATINSIPAVQFVQSGRLTSLEAAEQQCQDYLTTVDGTGSRRVGSSACTSREELVPTLPTTIGTLIVVTDYLESCCDIGMILEGTQLLRRLTGLSK